MTVPDVGIKSFLRRYHENKRRQSGSGFARCRWPGVAGSDAEWQHWGVGLDRRGAACHRCGGHVPALHLTGFDHLPGPAQGLIDYLTIPFWRSLYCALPMWQSSHQCRRHCFLDLHQTIVKSGTGLEVGQILTGELVDIGAVQAQLAPPDAQAIDHARSGARRDFELAQIDATLIENAHDVTVLPTPR